jgi:hypothetical protein
MKLYTQDVVERRIEDGKLLTVRFIVKKQRIPASLMWMVPAKHKACYVKETSVVSCETHYL